LQIRCRPTASFMLKSTCEPHLPPTPLRWWGSHRNFPVSPPAAGRCRRHWRSRIGSQCRSDITEQPETAAPGEPAPPAPGPAAGGPGRQTVWGLNGRLVCRAALCSGKFSCRSRPGAATAPTDRHLRRQKPLPTGTHPGHVFDTVRQASAAWRQQRNGAARTVDRNGMPASGTRPEALTAGGFMMQSGRYTCRARCSWRRCGHAFTRTVYTNERKRRPVGNHALK
jgi:hypothetical protein